MGSMRLVTEQCCLQIRILTEIQHSCGLTVDIFAAVAPVLWRESLQSDSSFLHFVSANQPAVCCVDPVLWPKQVSCKAWYGLPGGKPKLQ